MSDPVKKENKSQLLKRSIANMKNNASNLVDRVGVPVVLGYLNPIVDFTICRVNKRLG
jgi:hypothetical protein